MQIARAGRAHGIEAWNDPIITFLAGNLAHFIRSFVAYSRVRRRDESSDCKAELRFLRSLDRFDLTSFADPDSATPKELREIYQASVEAYANETFITAAGGNMVDSKLDSTLLKEAATHGLRGLTTWRFEEPSILGAYAVARLRELPILARGRSVRALLEQSLSDV
jgi:hypothetical protein